MIDDKRKLLKKKTSITENNVLNGSPDNNISPKDHV